MRGSPTKNRFSKRLVTNSDEPLPITNVNRSVHGVLHKPAPLVYASTATIDTTESAPFYSPYTGTIAWALANVTGAPTSTMQIDVLVGGVRIWPASEYLTINNGDEYSLYMKRPGNPIRVLGLSDAAGPPTPISVQVVTVAAATGPLIVTLGMRW